MQQASVKAIDVTDCQASDALNFQTVRSDLAASLVNDDIVSFRFVYSSRFISLNGDKSIKLLD
jgi:hypothetical protein